MADMKTYLDRLTKLQNDSAPNPGEIAPCTFALINRGYRRYDAVLSHSVPGERKQVESGYREEFLWVA